MKFFSNSFDEIIQAAIDQYVKHGKEGESKCVRILIESPKMAGFPILPPIICDIAMLKQKNFTCSVLAGWYTWNISDEQLGEVKAKLLSLEELLEEQEDDLEDEEE